MRKKKSRKFDQKRKGRRPNHQQKRKQPSPVADDLYRRLLSALYRENRDWSAKELFKELGLSHSARKPLQRLLTRLSEQKILRQKGKDLFSTGVKHGLAQGVVDQNVKGFGFVTNLSSKLTIPDYAKDPFLSPANMHSARHGDTVLIRIFKVKKDGRPEAEVLSVLNRGKTELTGFVTMRGGRTTVYPEDTRYPFTVQLKGKLPKELAEGDAVIVKIDEDNEPDSIHQQGSLLEILGNPDSVDVQMRLVIEKHDLPHEFSKEVLSQVSELSDKIVPSEGRMDLRKIQHVTIDGETAKDFDDAIAVEKLAKGFRLYVSIADVGHYVQPGSALDKEAYQRGTSIYFPGRVIPMLPERLSNDLCSLVPEQDRYAFTAILDFDRQGHLRKKSFSKSIIRSHKRFTYTTVAKILVDRDSKTRHAHKEFLTPLKWAAELAEELMRLRRDRGSIGFTIPEPFMELDDEGKITSIARAERNFAHQLIEEFMLAANEAVAELFTENHLEGLYRIHERPAPEKIQEFVEFGHSLGLPLPPLRHDPDWFGQVLDMVKGSPKEYVINNLLLRTMQQARYDKENAGHFGLAATDYTHFTSPIRRYPDLTVHRTLQTFLQRKSKVRRRQKGLPHSTKEMGGFLSIRERVAVTAEREMNDRLKVRFMHDKIGDEFPAVISGITPSTIFVELLDLFVSGGISLTSLKDDYYQYDAKHHRLTGSRKGRSFQIGDLLQVALLDVDLRSNRIYFRPASQNDA